MEFYYRPVWYVALESFFEDMEDFIRRCDDVYTIIKEESDDLFDTVDYDFHNGIKILYGECVNTDYLDKLADMKRLDEIFAGYSYEALQNYGKEVLKEQNEELANLTARWNETLERWKADFKRWKAEEA